MRSGELLSFWLGFWQARDAAAFLPQTTFPEHFHTLEALEHTPLGDRVSPGFQTGMSRHNLEIPLLYCNR